MQRKFKGLGFSILLATLTVGCAGQAPNLAALGPGAGMAASARLEGVAPLALASVASAMPAAPGTPSADEWAQLKSLQGQRAEREAKLRPWLEEDATLRWSKIARDRILAKGLPQPANARAMAMVHVAMHDAALVSAVAQRQFARVAPMPTDGFSPTATPNGPTYPNSAAAIGQAAAQTMAALFPEDASAIRAQAEEASQAPLLAGLAYPSDVAAGKQLGATVAAAVTPRLSEGNGEGGSFVASAGVWGHATPVTPKAGAWKTWVIAPSEVGMVPPPPAFGSEAFNAAADEVVAFGLKVSPEAVASAKKWDALPPATIWNDIGRPMIALKGGGSLAMARQLAFMHMSLADAFTVTWTAKYKYLVPRPSAVRPGFVPALKDPAHPSYPSHAALMSYAAASFLAEVMPEQAEWLKANAADHAMSRIIGGAHYRFDLDAGKVAGERIADAVAKRLASGR